MCFEKDEKKKLKRQPNFKNHDQKHVIKWNSVLRFLCYFHWDLTGSSTKRKRKPT